MTRFPKTETVDGFDVRNGRIVSPGKFEGEARYMPYMYDGYLTSAAGEAGDGNIFVELSADDVARFPELAGRDRVTFYEREDGFVVEVDNA